MGDYDIVIGFIGELAPEVTGVDALMYAYDRIGHGELDGETIGFAGEFLDRKYNEAAGFAARLMGAREGSVTNGGNGLIELTYNVNALEALVLRDSDKTVIQAKKNSGTLIDIAIIGVIYENLPDILKTAVTSGRGVCSSVRLTDKNDYPNETTGVKNTYNIITGFEETSGIIDSALYNELYYASQITVMASTIYGYISSGKRFF